jgi:hypothetical protein
MSLHNVDNRRKQSETRYNSLSIMKDRSGSEVQYTPGLASVIYTWWGAETKPGVTQEDE